MGARNGTSGTGMSSGHDGCAQPCASLPAAAAAARHLGLEKYKRSTRVSTIPPLECVRSETTTFNAGSRETARAAERLWDEPLITFAKAL